MSIRSVIDDAAAADNGLPGVPTATGLEALLDIDTYVLEYLKTVNWIGTDSVADGGVTVSEIWTGLVDFLRDHWMVTLPGIGSQGNPSFFTIGGAGDLLTVAVDIPYTISDTIPIDFGTNLGDSGLEVSGDLEFAFDLATGLAFNFSIDLSGENSAFHFDEFFVSAAVAVNDIELALTYQDTVSLTTHVGSDYGDLELNLGGSIYLDGGDFVFNHEQNKAGDVALLKTASPSTCR